MSTAPSKVCVKRKIDELAPERLIVESESEPQRKKGNRSEDVEAREKLRLQYMRVRREEEGGEGFRDADGSDGRVEGRLLGVSEMGGRIAGREGGGGGRRVFHLKKPRITRGAGQGGRQGLGSDERSNVATFVEARGVTPVPSRTAAGAPTPATDAEVQAPARPLKRPSRGLATAARGQPTGTVQDQARLELVANNLHDFALNEITNAPKPRVAMLPKYAGRRRDIERTPAAATEPRIRDDEDIDMDSDGDYVYETYILAPSSGAAGTADISMSDAEPANIGYLIITEEDQSVWETYIEDEPSDPEYGTDEEDENAEDYYGADYPEDEMASDDEGGRNAYGYRANGGSDGEEWDEDTGAHSDDDEFARSLDPWKARTAHKFVGHQKEMDGDDE
ncbi:hypothetical protein LTR91_014952 [Friedmanniomyces endolithicus]|uniref:Transcription factor Iwr1 domain-containing protein n=1 Tax=Friedmanniomyces endolithicus TaxID=329885 RepID=A0AAN6KB03_9PEZI|nr:hypothetical protein LTR01_003683 [Friedmanniomyces endolithicus]KAK0327653.1 hypothetical protein LTR82_001169 [Friedmanniomyces endolithicus]KAK0835832.1 hypothetical protein LTR73_000332 [Friedmanniomyces endolithicus]KAK0922524.1 hypothetical protein LTR57_007764 [Friedmanniomyces endolithicus]KAK0972942.1 hypothetical protein LTR91_014952 [Friedmanniomyces endolithicus]